jgi:hypothetical protein
MDNAPGHRCDWRMHGRYMHNIVVICVAPGHNLNTRMRVAPMLPDENKDLPKYDGNLDVHG